MDARGLLDKMKLQALGNGCRKCNDRHKGWHTNYGSRMYTQKKSKTAVISAVIASFGLALSGSLAWGKSNSNLAPGCQPDSVQVLVSKGKSDNSVSSSALKSCTNCVPYMIKGKAGVILSEHRGEALSKKDSVFEEGKLLVAVSKPNFKISLQPDGIKSGIYAVVEFPANCVALVEQQPSGMFRVANLLGEALPVRIRSKGKNQTVPVMAGEELSLAPDYVNDAELVPADGVDREPVACTTFISGCKATKNTFDCAQLVKSEKLFACDQTFTQGAGLIHLAKRELLAKENTFRTLTPIANAR